MITSKHLFLIFSEHFSSFGMLPIVPGQWIISLLDILEPARSLFLEIGNSKEKNNRI
jgi:hypothetical protein